MSEKETCTFCEACMPSEKQLEKGHWFVDWSIIDIDQDKSKPLSFDDYLSPWESLKVFMSGSFDESCAQPVFFVRGHAVGKAKGDLILVRCTEEPWKSKNRWHPHASWPAIKKER